jgi:hypothetical protein
METGVSFCFLLLPSSLNLQQCSIIVENNHPLQAGLVCCLKESSVLHLESSLITEPHWIQQQLENFFASQNWTWYELQVVFKNAVEEKEE